MCVCVSLSLSIYIYIHMYDCLHTHIARSSSSCVGCSLLSALLLVLSIVLLVLTNYSITINTTIINMILIITTITDTAAPRAGWR